MLFFINFLFGILPTANHSVFDPMNLDQNYRVAKISTPATEEKISQVLCDSYVIVHGNSPKDSTLSLAWAHVSLENARGKKIWNNNLGNQGPFSMKQTYYYHLKKGWPYRSFSDLESSSIAYWGVINKCPMAMQAFKYGDAARAASELKKCNYYSSSVEAYTKSLVSLYYESSKITKKTSCGSE
jgi:hypothetical protein